MPYRSTLNPPALVATTPPMRQEPCEPKVMGSTMSCSSAARLAVSSTQPASTTMAKPVDGFTRIGTATPCGGGPPGGSRLSVRAP